MHQKNPADVANAYFAALGSGDVPTAMGMFDADVVWHQPGANRFSGQHHGGAGIGTLLSGMMETSQGTFQLTVAGPAMVNGELVAVPVRFTGSRESASMDMAGIDLLRIRDGRIIEVFLFSEDGPAENAFWGAAE